MCAPFPGWRKLHGGTLRAWLVAFASRVIRQRCLWMAVTRWRRSAREALPLARPLHEAETNPEPYPGSCFGRCGFWGCSVE